MAKGVLSSAVGIRGDLLYCPLPLYVDSYWTCEPNCEMCYLRRLNRTWGQDFRMADVEQVKKKLSTKRGSTPLSKAIQLKKTIRMGNKSDPFQPWEEKYKVSTQIFQFLKEQNWDTVIQTKYPTRAYEMTGLGDNCTLMAEVTVGLEEDWELLEHERTENPIQRLKTLSNLQKKGFKVGVNGEPFIPGYHTIEQFENMMKLLKSYGLKRFNTYNLHFNDLVAKNFYKIGLDIEKIWEENQDRRWRKTLAKLIEISEKYDIILGCPDFVNSGWGHVQKCNTCCGIDVENPCTYNTHYFKMAVQAGKDPKEYWDGVGEYEEGIKIIDGTDKERYTLKDIAGKIEVNKN